MQNAGNHLRPIEFYKDLATGKGREEHGFFLVEGIRAVSQVASVSPESVDELLVTEGADVTTAGTVRRRVITEKQLRAITASKNPAGPVAVVGIPADTSSANLPADVKGNILVCEHLQDPGNVGALIRTAAAFGFAGAVLSDKCADPFAPKAVQATAGSIMSLWIRRSSSYLAMVQALKKQGLSLAAADLRGVAPLEKAAGKNKMLALGNEGSGLSDELLQLADIRFTIPINTQNVESLNVAACGAICMYQLSR